jgi:hypothetical protein
MQPRRESVACLRICSLRWDKRREEIGGSAEVKILYGGKGPWVGVERGKALPRGEGVKMVKVKVKEREGGSGWRW